MEILRFGKAFFCLLLCAALLDTHFLASEVVTATSASTATATKDTVTHQVTVAPGPTPLPSVHVYHFILKHWAGVEPLTGSVPDCPQVKCDWTHADHMKNLRFAFNVRNISLSHAATAVATATGAAPSTITLSLYNIHSLWQKARLHKPPICELPTMLTMAESEESQVRYGGFLFEPSFKNFHGFSTPHPTAQVQRVYAEAFLNSSHLLPMHNFTSLIKGGAYIASDCHRHDNANANRDGVIHAIRSAGFRVDGLGRCMRSPDNAEGISLPRGGDTRYNLEVKRKVIANYMFYFAFENSIEPGYVTEKPFDALIGGSVPVYLGDHEHLKRLLPHPKASINVGDFNGNATALVQYLSYLTTNETAYEEHRAWRHGFSYERNIKKTPLMEHSWFCRVCMWAAQAGPGIVSRGEASPISKCQASEDHTASSSSTSASAASTVSNTDKIATYEGKLVKKGQSRDIFLVRNHTLRAIPDFDTFVAMKLDWKAVVTIAPNTVAAWPHGAPMPALSA